MSDDRWLYNCRRCGRPRLPIPDPCVWCHGNAATAGLAAARLGTRLRYLRTAVPIPKPRDYLGSMFRFWLVLRLRGERGTGVRVSVRSLIPPWLGEALHVDAGYCLDAPNAIPAGSVRHEDLGDLGEPEGVPVQTYVLREPEG